MNQIGTINQTKAILDKYHLRAKKKFGQNFLIDLNILNNIVSCANLNVNDTVIEIGPGIGALTELLLANSKEVIAYEIDSQMVEILRDNFSDQNNLEIINQDFLKSDLSRFKNLQNIKIVANLPYYITTPILFHILESPIVFQSITTMMQKEVAQRLTAAAGTKDYGALTLMIEYFCQVQIQLKVPKTAFYPSPNVDSVVVQLTPKENFSRFQLEKQLFKLIDVSFVMRRKTLVNNLQTFFGKDTDTKNKIFTSLEEIGLALDIRAERLNLIDFQRLTDKLVQQGLQII